VTVPGGDGEVPVARFRVEWTPAHGDGRAAAVAGLTLPAVPSAVWDALPEAEEVRAQAALLLAARAKKAATRASERGDREASKMHLVEARSHLSAVPPSPAIVEDLGAVQALEALHEEDEASFRKQAKYESHRRHRSRPYQPGET
jgi:hypothetical protein